jgi:hypothetical protein
MLRVGCKENGCKVGPRQMAAKGKAKGLSHRTRLMVHRFFNVQYIRDTKSGSKKTWQGCVFLNKSFIACFPAGYISAKLCQIHD